MIIIVLLLFAYTRWFWVIIIIKSVNSLWYEGWKCSVFETEDYDQDEDEDDEEEDDEIVNHIKKIQLAMDR